ncbi:YkvA family protein [Pontibacter anaerobius]|uniref:YkvA family protein n=1 Tax=Pontibacter anaerobius TaxID=2993940 RepID=A0ABT3RKV0_9BACT|nr:YkvA family protein [Pontibacter anaerobius]MCX2742014.1 YkvA family protein [Pontibacter anaerobius]
MTDNKGPEGKKVAESPIFKKLLQKAEAYLKHPSEVAKLVSETLKKATAKKGVGALAGEVWENLQLLTRMLKAASSGEYKGIPTATLVGGVAVLIYFLMPIDIIPDVIPVVGLLDDASLLAWFMASIKTELDKFKEWDASRPIKVEPKTVQHHNEQHTSDISFGTPKYSDRGAGDIQTDTKTNF